MEIAVVVGQCTATIKDASLQGRKLALVRPADPDGVARGDVEVALDITGAGAGEVVLLVRGSAARQPADTRQLAADLAIVAILDEVTTSSRTPAAPKTGTTRPTKQASPRKTAKAQTRTRGK